MSSWNDAIRGKKLAPGVAYLSSPDTLTAKSAAGSLDLDDIDHGWACVAANVVKKAAEDYGGHLKQGKSKDQAMEMCSQSRFIAAKMHTYGYVSRIYQILEYLLTRQASRSSACSGKRLTRCRTALSETSWSRSVAYTDCGRSKSRGRTS